MNRAGTFALTRTVTEPAGVSVRYSIGGVDVTSAINAGKLPLPLDPWSESLMDVAVTRGKGVPDGSATRIVLRATAAGEPAYVDVARLVAKF